jgi:hypothetical protein
MSTYVGSPAYQRVEPSRSVALLALWARFERLNSSTYAIEQGSGRIVIHWMSLMCLFLLLAPPASAADLFEVSSIKRKIVEPADSEGDLLVSFKATVKNRTDTPQEAEVWIQGIDGDDFEVVEVQLFGRLKAKESRVLTNMVYVREKTYSSVVKWQVEEEPSPEDEDDFTSAALPVYDSVPHNHSRG